MGACASVPIGGEGTAGNNSNNGKTSGMYYVASMKVSVVYCMDLSVLTFH